MIDPNQFDPYHRWLGIRPEEQPADHYRLLGLACFEDDPEVIRDAAERQMRHVRSYQLGQHRQLSQKILNELAAAKACLLDDAKKTEYDRKLRQELTAEEKRDPPTAPPRVEPSPVSTTAAQARSVAIDDGKPAVSSKLRSRVASGRRRAGMAGWWRSPIGISAAVACGLAALVVLLWLVAPRRSEKRGGGTAGAKITPSTSGPGSANGDEGSTSVAADSAILVFEWPVSERKDATLCIDGETKPLPETGGASLRLPVDPGRHAFRVERQGFEPIEFSNVLLVAGRSKTFSLA